MADPYPVSAVGGLFCRFRISHWLGDRVAIVTNTVCVTIVTAQVVRQHKKGPVRIFRFHTAEHYTANRIRRYNKKKKRRTH